MARKTVSAELKERIKSVLSNVPISLNAHFGDPCQPNQWENTLDKIRYLKAQGYQGEIEISTKWILSDEQLDELMSYKARQKRLRKKAEQENKKED